MEIQEKLCSKLKQYNEVIIYGYANTGICVLDYIIDLETSIRLANYSGKVKYFATSNRERNSNRKEIKGIKIKSIYELQEYSETSLVIVATQEKHHDAINSILEELGFYHKLFILHEDYCRLRECVENHKTIINNNIQQYHLNHQIKLNHLREKVKNGKKVKVFFMIHDAAVFGSASIYWEMQKRELFEPYLYIISRRDVNDPDFYKAVKQDILFFREEGYRVIDGYDEWGNPKDMHLFQPDILFYDLPKLYGSAGNYYNRMDQLNWEYLTCYVPYGLLMVDSFYYHYHTKCIRETWKFFLDTNASFKRVLADGDFSAFNTVLSGYPKFDDYFQKDVQLPEKLNNGKPIVIYAPHHSLFVSNNFATFDLYKDMMLELARTHAEINFVLKPHPLLPFQIKARSKTGCISFTYEDYLDYVKEWENLPNGMCIFQGDYIKLFRASNCLITDCGSFIGEYLPSLHPCIYLFNPRKRKQEEVYTPLAKKILDTYYIARTEEEFKKYILDIVINGEDSKEEQRRNVWQAEFGNIGSAGRYICNYLQKQVTEEEDNEL